MIKNTIISEHATALRKLRCVGGIVFNHWDRHRRRGIDPNPAILEGVDGSGKSTLGADLGRHLHEHYGVPAITVHALKVDPKHWERDWIVAARLTRRASRDGIAVIWDRAWQSEPVYSKIMRDKPVVVPPRLKTAWERTGALGYLLDVPVALAQRRLRERGDEDFEDVYRALPKLALEYRDSREDLRLKFTTEPRSETTFDKIVQEILLGELR